MIEIRRVSLDDPTWATKVVACGGNALHLPAIQLVDAAPEHVHLLCFERGARLLACAVAVEDSVRAGRLSLRRRRKLILPTAPALADAADAAEVRSALFSFVSREGFDHVVVRASSSDWLVGDEDLAPYRTAGITEFVIDLRPGEEAVYAAMHKTHRKNIRRSQREGFHLSWESDLDALLALRSVQLASSERANDRAQGFAVGNPDFYRRLHERIYAPGHGRVLVASNDGAPLAALAWLALGTRTQTVRSGSLPDGYRLRVMYLLYDALIRDCLERGMVELNAGGVPVEASDPGHPQAGLLEFKQGFGGRAVTRYTIEVPVEEVAG